MVATPEDPVLVLNKLLLNSRKNLNLKTISVEIKTDPLATPILLQVSLDSLQIPFPNSYPEINIKSTKNKVTPLMSQNKGNYQYVWTPTMDLDKITSPAVIQTYTKDIHYTLTISSKEGCTATEKFYVFADPIVEPPTAPVVPITPPSETVIPNIFSPNNDQINDIYFITFNQPIINFQAEIYNRWGVSIFETTDSKFKWDGRYRGEIVSEGEYILKASYFENGKQIKWVKTIMVIK